MGLLEHCQELFKTSNLYDVFGVSKNASATEIRRGYYKVSLQVHPDRAPDDVTATEKFQLLGKLFTVLSDKEQRAIYDEQGIVDEENDTLCQDRDWEECWRRLFPKITVQDIEEFERKYKGSEEERQDVMRLYEMHRGDLDAIMEAALCCSHDDEPRICDLIQRAVDSAEITAYPVFTLESDMRRTSRKQRAEKERLEVEELQREMGLQTEDTLAVLLKQRQKAREQGFNSFLSDLEAKYCKPAARASGGRKGKK